MKSHPCVVLLRLQWLNTGTHISAGLARPAIKSTLQMGQTQFSHPAVTQSKDGVGLDGHSQLTYQLWDQGLSF